MKNKNLIYIITLLIITLVGFITVPVLVKKLTYDRNGAPFGQFSPILKKICLINFMEEPPIKDVDGIEYKASEYDSLFPFLNFRQLYIENRLPKEIDGHPITVDLIRDWNLMYRQNAADFSTPDIGLYLLYESASGKVDLSMPKDVFRLKDRIEFINPESNSIDEQKSKKFNDALINEGFSFPAKWVSGNMNPRKPYDQGVFILDNDSKLYHLIMIKGEPFVRDTRLSENIDIFRFVTFEQANKRAYGFIYSTDGGLYLIEREKEEGVYRPIKVDIAPLDLANDNIHVLGNMLYLSFMVENPQRTKYYGVRTSNLERAGEYTYSKDASLWNKVSKVAFPFILNFSHPNSDYIYPEITFNGIWAYVLNLLLGAVSFFIFRKKSIAEGIFSFIYVSIFGFIGLISIFICPKCQK